MMAQLDIELEEQKTKELLDLEKEYQRQIEIHNNGGEEPILQVKSQDQQMEFEMGGQYDNKHEETLWIEKYTSEKFFDLLTDEAINRNVLTWLKSWDEIVFPERSKVSLKLPDSILNQKGALYKKDLTFRKVDA